VGSFDASRNKDDGDPLKIYGIVNPSDMDLVSSESGGVPVQTALNPFLVTDTERSFQGGEGGSMQY
jgi:hypothetical protein